MIEISKFKCYTCDGSGFIPPISGLKEDGGRCCPECNNPVCYYCSGAGVNIENNTRCWDCNGVGTIK